MSEQKVIGVIGRWARLEDESIVTAIPSFRDLGFNARELDRRVREFQANPDKYLSTHKQVSP